MQHREWYRYMGWCKWTRSGDDGIKVTGRKWSILLVSIGWIYDEW